MRKSYGVGLSLVAASLLGMSSGVSRAADLGGNCCADLEERIAELEATTVRKGNRKVSLAISGWVAEQVMWWDDGIEQNVYVGGIGGTLATNVKFSGQAAIAPGWSAGYLLHVEAISTDNLGVNADNPNASADSLVTRQSYWFVKSEQLGKVGVGLQSQASDNAAILVDGSGSLVAANWVMFDNSNFQRVIKRRTNNGVPAPAVAGTYKFNDGLPETWGDLAYCQHIGGGIGGDCHGVPTNSVRYDTPTFGGFSVSATWGEDDFWDVAARYAGEIGGFKLAATVAYSERTDESSLDARSLFGERESEYIQGAVYIQHVPTGLFAYGAYGQERNKGTVAYASFDPADLTEFDFDNNRWYVKAGVRQRWMSLGHTVVYGEYGEANDMFSPSHIEDGYLGTEMRQWGVGLVQEIDAAAMSMWLRYRNYEGEGERLTAGGTNLRHEDYETFQSMTFGGLINF